MKNETKTYASHQSQSPESGRQGMLKVEENEDSDSEDERVV